MTAGPRAALGVTVITMIVLGTILWVPADSGGPLEVRAANDGVSPPAEDGSSPPVSLGFAVLGSRPFALAASTGFASACEHWVDPAGSDDAAGTANAPWRTLGHAAATVSDAGCTIWFRSGLYPGYQQIKRRFDTLTTFKAIDAYQAVFESERTAIDIDGARNVVFEGFEIRHSDPSATGHVVNVDEGDGEWAVNIAFRNNIIHDSYDNDLLKIHHGVRNAVVEGNLLFNQGDSEQHIDVNGVADIVIQDNIFFNDYASSGRPVAESARHFIIVKDSNEGADGLLGARRITIGRNVFLNWQGGKEAFVKVGNDGKPYHEADTVEVINNLLIGNSSDPVNTSFGVAGARRVRFANNTVIGDLPSSQYAFNLEVKGDNPRNDEISLVNNIWADPTGTMDDLSNGDEGGTTRLELRNNLYWNGGAVIPDGDLLSVADDPSAVVGDPRLPTDHRDIILPYWNGATFPSGNVSIRDEFLRLVDAYGRPDGASIVVGRSLDPGTPTDDIIGRSRGPLPDVGAYEVDPIPGTGLCPSIGTPFSDVAPGRYYSGAVRWLACEGITTGTSPMTYSPFDPVTRAQMAAFLWRFAGHPESGSLTRFSDVAPGRYYTEAVAWLDDIDVTTGTGPTTYSPDDSVTRAQMAAFLWRLEGRPEPTSELTPFTDVARATYYSTPVAWLFWTGLTTGTGPTAYSPGDSVTRAQMAAFLWRLVGRPIV